MLGVDEDYDEPEKETIDRLYSKVHPALTALAEWLRGLSQDRVIGTEPARDMAC